MPTSLAAEEFLRPERAYCPFSKVLQAAIDPLSNPRRNHCMRCADDPCVKESGDTCPVDIFCKRSSPTAAAAPRADSMSPCSSRLLCWVECAHTPAKQSACNSTFTETSF